MSRLCRLDIKGNGLTAVGLVAILDKCPLLEYLDIRDCYSLSLTLSESLKKRCIEQIKDLRLPVMNNYEDFDYLDFDNDFYDPYD
ncbi:F-box protein skip19 [Trifolium pratense]|uniref:F-box protein skip19 n=1 Tax=Trifolium pratense TaxID=57577 RepID=A0A2K3KQV3_TRIPR|nr:F-box protein skip19 [Trifolium pratense]